MKKALGSSSLYLFVCWIGGLLTRCVKNNDLYSWLESKRFPRHYNNMEQDCAITKGDQDASCS